MQSMEPGNMIAVRTNIDKLRSLDNTYFEIAAELRRFLENREGFISIERFQSLTDEGKILSLSFWRDESAVAEWRNVLEHRRAQKKGKEYLFRSYRIRVAEVIRDYTETDRNEAPTDSNEALK